ncbi:uncharacterized protein B0I36DRAFT_245264 [Microdochium trichocladiopsis]|uniref:Uncharacterized protein n=1 Tax=Microdochium trichocladiopsis TaxID=1682393 RepID=A0A9P9BPK8_9PEZI|nr:uncharacterized protein B0I36DRAFT_245264 [Microdochium trichocladiopsis]KAH7029215.1 hypothetical protein B0I36DRAFT_245264 [Microdochium trichocladiopsis]
MDDSTCIARRRTPRACTRASSAPTTTSTGRNSSATSKEQPSTQVVQPTTTTTTTTTTLVTKTPGKPKSRKRVRFSDPGPQAGLNQDDGEPDSGNDAVLSSTGLTPMVRRSSLGSGTSTTSSPSAKRRRHSTPISSTSTHLSSPSAASPAKQEMMAVHFPSLRQILSDRVKRRIRRNGLSEEMNVIAAEKKAQQESREAELEQLRSSLAAKDAEIERLRELSMLSTSSSNLVELEREVETLRQQLSSRSSPPHGSSSSVVRQTDDSRFYDWTMSARDPFSDEYTDMDIDVDDTHLEDSAFGDSTMVDLVCSTPSRRHRATTTTSGAMGVSLPAGSFPTPPCTSPTIPATPCSVRQTRPLHVPVTPSSHASASVQASLPDPDAVAVKAELESLRLELGKLTDTLESQAALQTRITEKVSSGLAEHAPKIHEDGQSSNLAGHVQQDNAGVESQLDKLLQVLSDRTAALHDLNSSLASLGFPGNDASEIITSLTASLRAARLELEYLTPGELSLPLTSHGAEVLDLVLSALRDLARREQEHEQTIDEYHALELSLRQQLSARVGVMDALRVQLKDSEASLAGRDDKISDLEVGIDRLKGAAEGYRRDIAELEALVQRMEGDMAAAADAAEIACNLALAELGAKLAAVIDQTETFDAELSSLHESKSREIRALNRSHGENLAVRDARVAELRREIDSINASLRRAYGTIQGLRVENIALGKQVEAEKTRARVAIDEMKAEMRHAVKMSSGFLATPKRGGSTPALAKPAKRPRRYDSGVGLNEDE